jgi:hypothetical protein
MMELGTMIVTMLPDCFMTVAKHRWITAQSTGTKYIDVSATVDL